MKLPQPPTDEEKILYVDQQKVLFYFCGVVSFVLLLAGMIFFSFTHEGTLLYLVFTALVAGYLGLSYFIGIFSRPFDFAKHLDIRRTYFSYAPSVDVFLPSCGEPIEVIENTFHWVSRLDYKGPLKVWVLDDSDRPFVRASAYRYGFEYIARPNRGELKKAGNIRYAFPQTRGEFILILDADFVPRSDFLREVLPHFAYDSDVAIVQSAQFFSVNEEQNWIERGAGYIQELFYRLIQTNRDSFDASICVGTCAVYRRSALEPHGGTYPIAYSEDLHTGWQVTVDGWKVRYLPLCLSKGLCPDSSVAFFTQQMRWCTGSTSLLTSRKFWVNKLGLMQRLCYASGMFYYVATALSIFLTPLPALVIVWFFPERIFWYNYLFSLPSFLFGTLILALWGKLKWGPYVLSVRQLSYYAHLFALWGRIRGTITPWVPTGDASQMRGIERYRMYRITLSVWISLVTLGTLTGAAHHMATLTSHDFYPLIAFSLLHYVVSMRCVVDES